MAHSARDRIGHSVVFFALCEPEAEAYSKIASGLISAPGINHTAVYTLLPRLARDGVGLIELSESTRENQVEIDSAIERFGYPDAAYVAHYDREWRQTRWSRKRSHVYQVAEGIVRILDRENPSVVISSVGGETVRCVVELLAEHRGIARLYFNGIPVSNRFVLLDALEAPFIPVSNTDPIDSLLERESEQGASSEVSDVRGWGPLQKDALDRGIFAEGITRLMETTTSARGVYPSNWVWRKTRTTLRTAAIGRFERTRSHFGKHKRLPASRSGGIRRVLYPLHDEEDFQVAVRERHALPQRELVRYVASTLPARVQLVLKPHPSHFVQHSRFNWRQEAELPNVELLSHSIGLEEALGETDAVFTLASSVGFEAISRGMPVICYGRPFYSGRGLSIDVSDPREIGSAIEKALGEFSFSATALECFMDAVVRNSHEGSFNPLKLDDGNLSALCRGLRIALKERVLL
jgi:hypothetical protein